MDKLLMFTNDDDKILSNYTLVSKDSTSKEKYDDYLKKYPVLENEDVYVVNKLNKEEKENLDNMIKKPLVE